MHGQKTAFAKEVIDQGVSPLPPDVHTPVAYCMSCGTRVLVRLQHTVDPRWMFGFCHVCRKDGIAQVDRPR